VDPLALTSITWYVGLRGRAIRKLSSVAEALETYFEPEEREYALMGFLSGLRAKYKVGKDVVDTVGVLYIVRPTHIFFYWLAFPRSRQ